MVIQIVLQVFISGFQIVVMKHLTSLEMFINLATAALWVPFVLDTAGSVAARDFLVNDKQLVIAVIDGLGLLLICTGLAVFYYFNNQFYSKENSRIEN